MARLSLGRTQIPTSFANPIISNWFDKNLSHFPISNGERINCSLVGMIDSAPWNLVHPGNPIMIAMARNMSFDAILPRCIRSHQELMEAKDEELITWLDGAPGEKTRGYMSGSGWRYRCQEKTQFLRVQLAIVGKVLVYTLPKTNSRQTSKMDGWKRIRLPFLDARPIFSGFRCYCSFMEVNKFRWVKFH